MLTPTPVCGRAAAAAQFINLSHAHSHAKFTSLTYEDCVCCARARTRSRSRSPPAGAIANLNSLETGLGNMGEGATGHVSSIDAARACAFLGLGRSSGKRTVLVVRVRVADSP